MEIKTLNDIVAKVILATLTVLLAFNVPNFIQFVINFEFNAGVAGASIVAVIIAVVLAWSANEWRA